MGKVIYNLNSLKDMLKLLYPEPGDNIVENRDRFYNREILIDKLDYVIDNMDKVFEKTQEEQKNYLYLILNTRLKELYSDINEYDKALNVNKKFISDYFNGLIDGSYKLDYSDVPLILIEAFLRLKVNKKLDEEIYQALRLFCPDSLNLIRSFPCSYSLYSDDEMNYEVWFDEEHLIKVMVEFCESVTVHKEFDIFEHMAFYTLTLLFETYYYCIDYTNVNEKSLELYMLLERMQKCCMDKSDVIKEVLTLYKSICDIVIMKKKGNEENLLKIEDFDDISKKFEKFFQTINESQCKEYKKELNTLIYYFLDFKGSVEDGNKQYFIETLKNLKNKPDLPNYTKELIEECLFNTWYVEDLFEIKEYKKITEIYYKFKDIESKFEYAYSLAECGDNVEAEKLYLKMINKNKASYSVYNNLGVIYENYYKDLHKAKEFYEKAIEMNSDEQVATKNLERVNGLIKDIEEKPKRLKDIYFKKTKAWHKKIMFAIYKLSTQNAITIEDLCEVTKQTENTLRKNLNFLKNLGLIVETKDTIMLEPAIEPVIRDYVDPKLERQIVKVDNTKLYRPIFYHESEIFMYRALMELFPQHMVFPNISLKTIFDIDKMRELLSEEELKYLFMAHVDYTIINTSNYFPVLAFEKDSDYNDTEYAKCKADTKNMIFRTGGIPLIRLRFNSSIDYEKLKSEIKDATKSLILEYSKDNSYEVDFNKEFDIKKFGIVSSPIDLELIKNDWELMVGRGTAQKSKVIDIEDGKLIIEISKELKPIIELSEEVIKDKFMKKYKVIKEVEFTWY